MRITDRWLNGLKKYFCSHFFCANTYSSLRSSSYFQSSPYDFLLTALDKDLKSLSLLEQIHALVITNGFSSKSVLACRLISSYASLTGTALARKLFDSLPERSVRVYSYMLKAYIDGDQCQSTIELYSRMISVCETLPNPVTFSMVLKACVSLRSLRVGRIIHSYVSVTGSELDLHLVTDLIRLYSVCDCVDVAHKLFDITSQRDVVVWTAMIDGLLRSGDYSEALRLFSNMRESGLKANTITWNALIAGFARDELMSDVLRLFNLMQVDGVRPDKVSLCTILPMFSRSAIVKPGLEAHAYAFRNGFGFDLFVASAFVDMYAKCGKLASAQRLFDQVELKDVGLWNAVIVGYGMHGNCKKALHLLHQMIVSGVTPNEITFTSILSACSHTGMVSEGCRAFNLMVQDYGIVASNEHCACMVDMLSRAGLLEEAFEFIRSMPQDPTNDIWGAFLSGCRIHPNTKLAEMAAQHMLGSKDADQEAGYHVIMSNIYAELGRWVDVAKLRIRIRDVNLKKRMGCSWIEVRDIVHTFNIADKTHPQSEQIYAVLQNLEDAIFGLL